MCMRLPSKESEENAQPRAPRKRLDRRGLLFELPDLCGTSNTNLACKYVLMLSQVGYSCRFEAWCVCFFLFSDWVVRCCSPMTTNVLTAVVYFTRDLFVLRTLPSQAHTPIASLPLKPGKFHQPWPTLVYSVFDDRDADRQEEQGQQEARLPEGGRSDRSRASKTDGNNHDGTAWPSRKKCHPYSSGITRLFSFSSSYLLCQPGVRHDATADVDDHDTSNKTKKGRARGKNPPLGHRW